MGKETKTRIEVVPLVYNEKKIVGMYAGYFHVQLLVEDEKGERQILGKIKKKKILFFNIYLLFLGWGYNSK